MNKKSTEELENALSSTHISDYRSFREENREELQTEPNAFSQYMKGLFREKGISQQTVFLNADIPERYGYKLLSGEKHTRQRDVILRICYSAGFTLEETQETLKKYEAPQLYARIPRDALLMVIFNEHPGSIINVNGILREHGFEPLRTSGLQE